MEDYGVLTYGDRQEYVYPSGGIKVRNLKDKGFYAKSGFKGDELFGMNLFTAGSSKMVTITEGELDALSVAQMMKGAYANPVVSLPSATPSKKLLLIRLLSYFLTRSTASTTIPTRTLTTSYRTARGRSSRERGGQPVSTRLRT